MAADGTDASEVSFGRFSRDVGCVSLLVLSGGFCLYDYVLLVRGAWSFGIGFWWEVGSKYLGD